MICQYKCSEFQSFLDSPDSVYKFDDIAVYEPTKKSVFVMQSERFVEHEKHSKIESNNPINMSENTDGIFVIGSSFSPIISTDDDFSSSVKLFMERTIIQVQLKWCVVKVNLSYDSALKKYTINKWRSETHSKHFNLPV